MARSLLQQVHGRTMFSMDLAQIIRPLVSLPLALIQSQLLSSRQDIPHHRNAFVSSSPVLLPALTRYRSLLVKFMENLLTYSIGQPQELVMERLLLLSHLVLRHRLL